MVYIIGKNLLCKMNGYFEWACFIIREVTCALHKYIVCFAMVPLSIFQCLFDVPLAGRYGIFEDCVYVRDINLTNIILTQLASQLCDIYGYIVIHIVIRVCLHIVL